MSFYYLSSPPEEEGKGRGLSSILGNCRVDLLLAIALRLSRWRPKPLSASVSPPLPDASPKCRCKRRCLRIRLNAAARTRRGEMSCRKWTPWNMCCREKSGGRTSHELVTSRACCPTCTSAELDDWKLGATMAWNPSTLVAGSTSTANSNAPFQPTWSRANCPRTYVSHISTKCYVR